MSKEKLKNLVKYLDETKNKLSSPLPEKHKNNPKEYKQFLDRELDATSKKVKFLQDTTPTGSK